MSTTTTVPARRRIQGLRWAAIASVVLLPLAFAGLFLASIGDPSAGAERVPVAIVNDDEAIIQPGENGEESYVLAGRQLVTELTGSASPAKLDWRLTNDAAASKMLASGEVYAILTVPKDFSASILSLSGDSPTRASIAIRTDDARSYVSGAVASALGDGMVRAFGSAITEQFIVGVFDEVGASLSGAAEAAQQLADGAAQAASGASEFADGVGAYAGGVRQLASGARELETGAAGLDSLVAGTREYVDGVSALSAQIAAVTAQLQLNPLDPIDPVALGTLSYLSGLLEGTAGPGGSQLIGGTSTAVSAVQSGISELANGAQQLSQNGSSLAVGAGELAVGIDELAAGSGEFASGLQVGAEQFSGQEEATSARAEVAATPVGYELTTENRIQAATQAIATPLVPLALWIGALVVFLALPPLTRGVLGSSARSGRLLGSTLARAGAVAGAQALLLVGLLHLATGVSWTLLPATLLFSLLTAAAFTAFHAALAIAFGRPGLIGSFVVLAVQLAALGSIVPVEALAPPFAAVSPYLPLTWATSGLQQIITSGSAAEALGMGGALFVFGAGSVLIATIALGRTRRAVALGLLPSAA